MKLYRKKISEKNQEAANDSYIDYFQTDSFQKHKDNINGIIMSLPYRESPDGWGKYGCFAVGGLEYIGFSDDSCYLLVVSSSGRGVINISSGEFVARDKSLDGEWLDENHLLCQGIGPLEGKVIRTTGIGGGGLPTQTLHGDSVYLAAPSFPCYDVVYQPSYQNCLIDGQNNDCVKIYRGFVNYCGFSWDGNTMVVVDEDINIWCRHSKG